MNEFAADTMTKNDGQAWAWTDLNGCEFSSAFEVICD
jgi:hypothetical protein